MKSKWLTATALASMLALSPALAQQGQQQEQKQQQQQPEQQQLPEQQPTEQQPEKQPEQQQPEELQQPEQLPSEEEQPPQQPQEMPETVSAMDKEQIVGKDLYGSEDTRIGKIRDVVQTEKGEIEAVVLDVGGFLGIGAKQIAVPVYELEAKGDRIVAADLTRDQIKRLPEYKKAEE